MEKILDFSIPFENYIPLFDYVCNVQFQTQDISQVCQKGLLKLDTIQLLAWLKNLSKSCLHQVFASQKVLAEFQEHPQSWTRAQSLIEHCNTEMGKLTAAGMLEKAIKTRWKVLPKEYVSYLKRRSCCRGWIHNFKIPP